MISLTLLPLRGTQIGSIIPSRTAKSAAPVAPSILTSVVALAEASLQASVYQPNHLCPSKKNPVKHLAQSRIAVAGEVKLQSVVTLANDRLKPTKLRQHLETKHAHLAKKTRYFFVRQLQDIKKQKDTVKNVPVPANALEASYHIAYYLGKNKKPFTDAE
ncbi:SCAN domain-containing protein 3-like isoform X1 [Ambystoma mexicanum]|uniref:SCAN domain-containing protein 3-like isoform X1 n=1 Tax=Ambystoma mexicanum TaxID=8296 RepID=UPI0037E72BD7